MSGGEDTFSRTTTCILGDVCEISSNHLIWFIYDKLDSAYSSVSICLIIRIMGCKRLGTPVRSRRKRWKWLPWLFLVYTLNLMGPEVSWCTYGLNQLLKYSNAGVKDTSGNKQGQYACMLSAQPSWELGAGLVGKKVRDSNDCHNLTE